MKRDLQETLSCLADAPFSGRASQLTSVSDSARLERLSCEGLMEEFTCDGCGGLKEIKGACNCCDGIGVCEYELDEHGEPTTYFPNCCVSCNGTGLGSVECPDCEGRGILLKEIML